MKLLSSLLFVTALVSFACFIFLLHVRTTPRRLEFNVNAAPISTLEGEGDTSTAKPAGIIIEKIGVWLPVYAANITNGNWETTTKGVSFLNNSGIVGVKGNAIFYGHNWPNLLSGLTNVVPGDRVKIVLSDNTSVEFVVETTQEVTPDDTSILAQTDSSRVTIYTCSGFLDSKRFVIVAIPA